MSELREVVIQARDFQPGEQMRFGLSPGERILNVESGNRFNPTRVWIEVPAELVNLRDPGGKYE